MSTTLIMIGTFGAQLVYNTYLAIGSAVDDYITGDAELDETNNFLDGQCELLSPVIASLEVLTDGDTLTNADAVTILNMMETLCNLQLLAATSKLLFESEVKTAQTNAEEDHKLQATYRAEYEEYRAESWAGISSLLGLK